MSHKKSLFRRLLNKTLVLSLLALLLGLVAGLYLFFPLQPLSRYLQTQADKQLPGQVQLGQLQLHPPLAISCTAVQWQPAPDSEAIRMQQLRLSPAWGSLLQGQPAVQIQAQAYSGQLQATYTSNQQLRLHLHNLQLKRPLPGFSALQSQLHLAQGQARLHTGSKLDQWQGSFSLQLKTASLHGLQSLGWQQDQLKLGRIQLQGSLKRRKLSLKQLQARQGELRFTGKGALFLQSAWQRSRLQFQAHLQPHPQAPQDLRSWLGMLGRPDADGRYQLRLNGSLGHLSLN